MDLGGAGGDGPKVGADVGVAADVGGKGFAGDRAEVAAERCDLDLAGFAADALGEAEDLADEGGAALGAFFEHHAEQEIAGGGDVRAEQRHAQENRREDVGDVVGDAGGESGDACEGWGAGAFGACAEGAFDGGNEALERVLEDVMGGAFPDGRDGALFPQRGGGKTHGVSGVWGRASSGVPRPLNAGRVKSDRIRSEAERPSRAAKSRGWWRGQWGTRTVSSGEVRGPRRRERVCPQGAEAPRADGVSAADDGERDFDAPHPRERAAGPRRRGRGATIAVAGAERGCVSRGSRIKDAVTRGLASGRAIWRGSPARATRGRRGGFGG